MGIVVKRSQMWSAVVTVVAIAATLGWDAVQAWRLEDPERFFPAAHERYLYVWAGDQARSAPDFLTVVDFNPLSRTYGTVLNTQPLPEPGATGNEPHHVGLSADGRTLALGGLLSILKGQPEIFFYDVSSAVSPRFISSSDPPQSSVTDEFYPLPGGGFLVTMMGGPEGHHPGRVVEYDRH